MLLVGAAVVLFASRFLDGSMVTKNLLYVLHAIYIGAMHAGRVVVSLLQKKTDARPVDAVQHPRRISAEQE